MRNKRHKLPDHIRYGAVTFFIALSLAVWLDLARDGSIKWTEDLAVALVSAVLYACLVFGERFTKK